MQNSKLIRLLQAFTKSEILALRKYVRGSVAGTRKKTHLLLEVILDKDITKIHQKNLIFERIFGADEVYDDLLLRRVMSELNVEIQNFIVQQALNADILRQKSYLIAFYNERGFADDAENALQDADKHIKTTADTGDILYFYNKLYLEEMRLQYQQLSDSRNFDLETMNDTLNTVLIAGKLRHHIKTFLNNRLYKNDFPLALLQEILAFVEESEELYAVPIVAIYYHAYQMLYLESREHYEKYRALLAKYITIFPPDERADLYAFAENFWAFSVQKNKASYTDFWELYREGFEKSYIFQNDGSLSVLRLQNAMTVAIRAGQTEWALQTLHTFRDRLDTADQEEVYSFNLATIHFQEKRYETVKSLLQSTNYTNTIYRLAASRLQIKLYYEENKKRTLQTALNSFERYLMTTKRKIETDNKATNLAFTRALRRLIDLSYYDRRTRAAGLEKLVADMSGERLMAERPWLLIQIETMKKH